MGSCASTQYANKGGNLSSQSSVNIVHLDGRLQQLKKPVKAWHVLSQNPNCFICSSESMYVGSPMQAVVPSEELQLGHIYFIVSLSKSRVLLSLQDLGELALKANAALAQSKAANLILKPSPLPKRDVQRTHPIVVSSAALGCSH